MELSVWSCIDGGPDGHEVFIGKRRVTEAILAGWYVEMEQMPTVAGEGTVKRKTPRAESRSFFMFTVR